MSLFDLRRINSTLLVGEGNFSFTKSLINLYPRSAGDTTIATSYETKDTCLAKYESQQCEKNIEYLSKNQVKVLHGIDATSVPAMVPGKLDAVIFQFPHTGRKSSIKENRRLLSEFFQSVASVLDPDDGFVIVTLCAGQGGTPADSVQREHCNSWQIVEMAAESGFILTDTECFDASKFPDYVPTGKRNWSNCFRTDLAMSHKFVVSEGLPCLQNDWVSESNGELPLPSTFTRRVWTIENRPEHIFLHSLTQFVVEKLGCPQHYIKDMFRNQIINAIGDVPRTFLCHDTGLDWNIFQRIQKIHCQTTGNDCTNVAYHYATFSSDRINTDGILAGISYHLVFMTKDQLKVLTQLKSVFVDLFGRDLEISLLNTEKVECDKASCDIFLTTTSRETIIGSSFKIDDVTFLRIIMNNAVLSLRHEFFDTRMYWTLDKKDHARMSSAVLGNSVYKPLSIYPMEYKHDISFWICPNEGSNKIIFSEKKFAALVSLIADEAFHSIELLDKYQKESRTSLLYRITYKSLHFVLSRSQCLKIQQKVRDQIEKALNVQLR